MILIVPANPRTKSGPPWDKMPIEQEAARVGGFCFATQNFIVLLSFLNLSFISPFPEILRSAILCFQVLR